MEYELRIRGKIGEIATPIEDEGKFLFNMFITVGGLDDKAIEVGPFGPFDTFDTAKTALNEEAISIMKMIKTDIGGIKDGSYFDFKDGGKAKNWTVH